ncbi:MAG TPA: hypothetical protein QF555_05415, partial [Candidatus Thalassarchaeaceae archaeon]|nr:hypothetical protein [Candidatus Thalassarchaeaceae archaeon]
VPGPYGFRLHAASTLGNFSVSTVMVVDVNGTHLFDSNFSSDDDWTPGSTGNVTLTLNDIGTDGVSLSLVPGSISSTGACLVDSVDSVDTNAAAAWLFGLDILSSAHDGDLCNLNVSIHEAEGGSTTSLSHSFAIGSVLSVEVELPSQIISIEPGISTTVDVILTNIGTEDLVLSASSSTVAGLSITIQDTTVSRGTSELMAITISADSDIEFVGNKIVNITFLVDAIGALISIDGIDSNVGQIELNVLPWTSLRVVPPQTSGITMEPGSTTLFSFDIENVGTSSVDASLVWSAIPAGISFTTMNGSISLTAGETTTISVSIESDQSAIAENNPVTFELVSPLDGSSLDSLVVSLSITPRGIPSLSTGSSQLSILGSVWSTVDFTIANTGNSAGVFEIVLSETPNDVQVILSESAFSVAPGSTQPVVVQVKGDGVGTLTLRAFSTNGPAFNSTATIQIVQGSLAAQVTLSPSVSSLQHDEILSLSGYIFNPTDNSGDYSLEVLSSLDCALGASSITVPAGSSIEVLISCGASSTNLAGSHEVTLMARPVDFPSAAATSISNITLVESIGPNGALLLDIELVDDGGVVIDKEGSLTMVIRVENTGNSQKKGILILSGRGINSGLVKMWDVQPTGSMVPTYDLAPGDAVTMSLTLTSNNLEAGLYNLTITASEDDGTGTMTLSPIGIYVQDDPAAPAGISLPTGHSINNSTSLSLMLGGYIFAILSVMVLRWTMRRSRESIEAIEASSAVPEESEITEPVEEEIALAEGEVRPSVDGSAICPYCTTRSKLPKDKTPPFRFRCPSCSEVVRVVE